MEGFSAVSVAALARCWSGHGGRRLVGWLWVVALVAVALVGTGVEALAEGAPPFHNQALVPVSPTPSIVQDPVSGRNFTLVNDQLVAHQPDGTTVDSLPAAQNSGMVLHDGALFVVRGRGPHLERVDPVTWSVTSVMSLPELFRGGRMWSTPWGLLSFDQGSVAVIDPVGRTLRRSHFAMPGTFSIADWVQGTTQLVWSSGADVGVIDFSKDPMTMLNQVRFAENRGVEGLVAARPGRLLVSGVMSNAYRTVELTIPGLVPTGYEFAGGGAVGVSPDGRWIASVSRSPTEQLHFLVYGATEPSRVLEHRSAARYPETLQWSLDGSRLLVGNGYFSPDGSAPDQPRQAPVVPVVPTLSVAKLVPMPEDARAIGIEPTTGTVFVAAGGGLKALDADGILRAQVLFDGVERAVVGRGAVYVLGSNLLRRVDPVTLWVTGSWPIWGEDLALVNGKLVISRPWEIGVLDPGTGTVEWIPTSTFTPLRLMRSPTGSTVVTCESETGTFFRLDLGVTPYQMVRLGQLWDHQACSSGELSADGSTLLVSAGQADHVEELRLDPVRIQGRRYGPGRGPMATGEGWLATYGSGNVRLFRIGSTRAVGQILDRASNSGAVAIGHGRLYVLEGGVTQLVGPSLRIIDLPGGAAAPTLPTSPHGAYGEFHPIRATRVLDTRAERSIVSSVGVPRSVALLGNEILAGAVLINITVVAPTEDTYVTVYSAYADSPFVSNLNVRRGETRANLAVIPVDYFNRVQIRSAAGYTDMVIDTLGWFGVAQAPQGYRMSVVDPVRVLDTRELGPMMTISAVRRVTFAGQRGVPAGADAVLVNITVLTGFDATFVTGYPSGDTLPGVSHVYAPPRSVVPNLALVPLGEGGAADFFSAAGAHLVIDVVGFTATSTGNEAGRLLPAVTPTRVFDTREDSLAVSAGAPLVVSVGTVGLRRPGLRPGAIVLNVTATDASADTYVTVHAADISAPWASNLNVVPGAAVANLTLSRMDGAGRVNLVNGAGSVHVIGDVAGYLSAA